MAKLYDLSYLLIKKISFFYLKLLFTLISILIIFCYWYKLLITFFYINSIITFF